MLRSPRLVGALRATTRTFCLAVAVALLLTPLVTQPAGAAFIRPDGRLEVDGEPMFPIGLLELGTYYYADWNQRIIDSGANLVWDIEIAYADTTPTCAAVMDAAVEGGYYLMLGSGDTWNWDDPATPELEVDKQMYEPAETSALVDCIAEHPSRVIAVANRDEPIWTIGRGQIGDIDEAHVHDTYDQLRTLVPSAVVGMNFAPAHLSQDVDQWKAEVASYNTATDVMMFAGYPYPAGPGTCGPFNVLGYPECTLDRWVVGLDVFLSELNQPGQPLWAVVQGFKNIPLKEARWQAVASVVHGATGILWAGWSWWHDLGHGSATWPVTSQVMSEMSALQPWLVGKDLAGAESNQPDVELRVLKSESEIVAFAISRRGYTGPATLTLPRLGGRRVRVMNEGRTIDAVNGSITDTFDGYQAHIYMYEAFQPPQIGWRTVDAPELGAGDAAKRLIVDAYPNPTAGSTTIRFSLPKEATVLLTVFDAAGRRVAVIGRGTYAAGPGTAAWNGRDLEGRPVAPGAYFVRATTSDGEKASARVLIRR